VSVQRARSRCFLHAHLDPAGDGPDTRERHRRRRPAVDLAALGTGHRHRSQGRLLVLHRSDRRCAHLPPAGDVGKAPRPAPAAARLRM
ncbi:MAG: hypothetical protein AVDCRST_MAG69-2281, partial [uncultured Solirubrobacteraceae bacterium]